jgi:hypothetical protein
MSAQTDANRAAAEDGWQARAAGLGLTKSGHYNFDQWRRLFGRGFRQHSPYLDAEEAYEYWVAGWHDADDRICHAQTN